MGVRRQRQVRRTSRRNGTRHLGHACPSCRSAGVPHLSGVAALTLTTRADRASGAPRRTAGAWCAGDAAVPGRAGRAVGVAVLLGPRRLRRARSCVLGWRPPSPGCGGWAGSGWRWRRGAAGGRRPAAGAVRRRRDPAGRRRTPGGARGRGRPAGVRGAAPLGPGGRPGGPGRPRRSHAVLGGQHPAPGAARGRARAPVTLESGRTEPRLTGSRGNPGAGVGRPRGGAGGPRPVRRAGRAR